LRKNDSGFFSEGFVVFEKRLSKLVARIEIVQPYYCIGILAGEWSHFTLSVVVIKAVVNENIPELRLN
jgi:hypothetical protein